MVNAAEEEPQIPFYLACNTLIAISGSAPDTYLQPGAEDVLRKALAKKSVVLPIKAMVRSPFREQFY